MLRRGAVSCLTAVPELLAARLLAGVAAITIAILLALAGPVNAHDPYTEWKDGRGYSCCNGTANGHEGDCQPVRAWPDMEGRWHIRIYGRDVLVPADAILSIPSPDGRSHACMTPSATEPRCFVPGEIRG